MAAKRYLLATDPAYAALLSARSEETLGFQGGVMTAAEVAEFEQRPDRDDLVALRRADDAAKVRNARRRRTRVLAPGGRTRRRFS